MLTVRMSTIAILCMMLAATMAEAQATRTWVSGVGDDANPCSRTAPCKTFAGAISKTAARGEINVIDNGAFGGVTITKAITIANDGLHAGVLATLGSNAIVVNAGVNDTVVLRGLDINGAGSGGTGIRFFAGKSLHVEDCRIYGFAGKGIEAISPTAGAQLFVKDTIIRSNAAGGILFGIGGVVTGIIDGVRIQGNSFGIRAEATNAISVVNTNVTGNSQYGIVAVSGVPPIDVNIENTVVSHNGQGGVRATGANARVRLSNSTVMNNPTGLAVTAGGLIESFGNNRVYGNVVDGAATGTVPFE